MTVARAECAVRKLLRRKGYERHRKRPYPQSGRFSPQFVEQRAIFSDFSTTRGLVRGLVAIWKIIPPWLRSNNCWKPSPMETGKPVTVTVKKFATAHDLRRAFGTRWAKKVMPAVLQRLMRHQSIGTTMKFYVGIEADDVAADLWAKRRRRTKPLVTKGLRAVRREPWARKKRSW